MRCRDKVHFPTEKLARDRLTWIVLHGPRNRLYIPSNIAECMCTRGGYVLTSKSAKIYSKGKGKNKAYGYAQRSRRKRR